MDTQNKRIVSESINQRISEIRREIQVLSTEESKLFFAAQPAQLMVAMSRMIDLKKELEELEIQADQLSAELNIAV